MDTADSSNEPYSKPAVRHVIVALGSLHENLKFYDYDQALASKIYSLQHYNKAVFHLKKQLNTSQQSTGVTLICCILFVCFEILQGDYNMAITQLKNGLNILCNWQAYHTVSEATSLSPEGQFIKENLLPLYSRLDIQATTVAESRGLGFLSNAANFPINVGKVATVNKIPVQFSSTREARYWLDILLYSMYNKVVKPPGVQTIGAPKPENPNDGPAQPEDIARDWATAFSAYVKSQPDLETLSISDVRAGTILKIYHTVARIMIGTRLTKDHASYEPFYSGFKEITTLCKFLIRSSNKSLPPQTTFRFSLDMGVVPPLFYVAMNCRNMDIRTEAISLLSVEPRREGVWDGLLAAKVARKHTDVNYSSMGATQ